MASRFGRKKKRKLRVARLNALVHSILKLVQSGDLSGLTDHEANTIVQFERMKALGQIIDYKYDALTKTISYVPAEPAKFISFSFQIEKES